MIELCKSEDWINRSTNLAGKTAPFYITSVCLAVCSEFFSAKVNLCVAKQAGSLEFPSQQHILLFLPTLLY